MGLARQESRGYPSDVKGTKKTSVKSAPKPATRVAGLGRGRTSDKALDMVLSEVTAAPVKVHAEQWIQTPCPYCGEEFEVHVTWECGGQTMYEDCHVCCRPISLHIQADEDGELAIEATRS